MTKITLMPTIEDPHDANYYTNPNTNPKTLVTRSWTLTDSHYGRRL